MRAALVAFCLVAWCGAVGCGDSTDPEPRDAGGDGAAPIADGDPAADGGPQARVVGTGPEGLNMRDGPGTEYTILRVIPEGQVVDILGGPENTDWWNVEYEGYVGWVSGQFLEFL